METSRVSRSERRAERKRKSDFPQLAPAPDDYPVFPDTSTWPVVFPALPPSPDGGPRRPPQHISKAAAPQIPAQQLPNHVAIVMDGNGRWATQRGLPRVEGHKMGEAVVIDIVCGAIEVGIKWLSLYAFSTENWKRSADEVRFLMGFNRDVVRRRRVTLNEMGVKIRWVGSRPRLWRSVINELAIAEEMTLNNDVITVNYCVNYGGRTEIAEAARDIAREAAAGKLNPERVTEATVARHLHRPDIPDVDLLLRTSGEQRTSNFMLWQAAYAEYIFQDTLWPDYDRRASVGGLRGVRIAPSTVRDGLMPSLQERLLTVLSEVLPVDEESDGALTVHHDGTIASLRVVTISEDLDLVSLTQIVAWDLVLTKKIRDSVAEQSRPTCWDRWRWWRRPAAGSTKRNSSKSADVLLRYNFPGGGLSDEALRTLVSDGARQRR